MIKSDFNFHPRHYNGVTISSTFADLTEHRMAMINTIKMYDLKDVAMENSSAGLLDVIDASLQMVRDGAVYFCIIGKRYGEIYKCSKRNPDNLSITELEFDEAIKLNRPILLFLMGKDHPVKEEHIETVASKKKKLRAFIEKAKKMADGSSVNRVYAVFNSLDEFEKKIGPSILRMQKFVTNYDATETISTTGKFIEEGADPVPKPPVLFAHPPYIGSHSFVGRRRQLEELNDWALSSDQRTIFLIEAIGGNGKSMLTWEWTKNHATKIRNDWAGIFWYSFYEQGAIMADFCQRALTYITGKSLEEFKKKKLTDLKESLMQHLNNKPWLLILDGLERVLVAYHRIDSSYIPDEDLNIPADKIVNRDPSSCINYEDDDLLRSLASGAPSKILVSSRLSPRVLFNSANLPIPGVNHILLPGLRPDDAEKLFQSCQITGNSEKIQNYLIVNCDCHPLTIGVLAGLVNDFLPDKGNFDAWIVAPSGGRQLNLANLDLISRRNHILKAGLRALSESSHKLLSTLALLNDGVDYATLAAFNPHTPSEPEEVKEPQKMNAISMWERWTNSKKRKSIREYAVQLQLWKQYKQAFDAWRLSTESLELTKALKKTINDLESRGLLQYDHYNKQYDLHPVVRGVVSGRLKQSEKEQYGATILDYFSAQQANPYKDAETLEELNKGMSIVQTLLRIGRHKQAFETLQGDLLNALVYNFEAYQEVLNLLRPFFYKGWGEMSEVLEKDQSVYLSNYVAWVFFKSGEMDQALHALSPGILYSIEYSDISQLRHCLRIAAQILFDRNHFALSEKILCFSFVLGEFSNDYESLFLDRLIMFRLLYTIGRWSAAGNMWDLLLQIKQHWPNTVYTIGEAELDFAIAQFYKWGLKEKEEELLKAEQLINQGKMRANIRRVHSIKGRWHMEQSQWHHAVQSFAQAVKMARSVGVRDLESETWLAIANLHVNNLPDSIAEAERLSSPRELSYYSLAKLWSAIGQNEEAKRYGLKAYEEAWGNGSPFAHEFELEQIINLLQNMHIAIPQLAFYDPQKDIELSWESRLRKFLTEKLFTEKNKTLEEFLVEQLKKNGLLKFMKNY